MDTFSAQHGAQPVCALFSFQSEAKSALDSANTIEIRIPNENTLGDIILGLPFHCLGKKFALD